MTPTYIKPGWRSDDAYCLTQQALQQIAKVKPTMARITDDRGMLDVIVEGVKTLKDRPMVLVDLAGKRIAWCDKVTGQLYDRGTGRCLSSDQGIRIE